MSVIQTIRDRGTWIIFVIIAVALIAFILQDGAGRGGSAFSNSSVIAKVNGTTIDRGTFEERLKNQEAMYAGQGATREQLIGNVFNMEVDNIVLNQEFEKLGLSVSAKEVISKKQSLSKSNGEIKNGISFDSQTEIGRAHV